MKFKKGTVVWATDDDILFELQDKVSGRPLYAVIVDEEDIETKTERLKKELAFPRILNCIQCGARFKADKYADYCPNCAGAK